MSGRRPNEPRGDDHEARFDAELARVTRALATEDLPRGILDPGLDPGGALGGVRVRRTLPAYAGIAAVLVLLLATAIALTPGGLPPASPAASGSSSASAGPSAPSPSPTPAGTAIVPGTFRSTSEIRADLETLRYACRTGSELLPTGPSPSAMVNEGAICTPPTDAGPFEAAVIVGEARDGRVVEVHVKANLILEDTPAVREQLAVPIAKAAAIAASGQGVGNQLAAWLLDAVPSLSLDDSESTVLGGFSLKVVRSSSGSYLLVMHEVPASP